MISRHDVIRMRHRTLVFVFFAAAMLFSMIREWSAPVGCPRLAMTTTMSGRIRHSQPLKHQ
jgi:hypothetical protein